MKKEKILKRGWVYLLIVINTLIMMTITNNSIKVDLILGVLLIINSLILLKYGKLERFNVED